MFGSGFARGGGTGRPGVIGRRYPRLPGWVPLWRDGCLQAHARIIPNLGGLAGSGDGLAACRHRGHRLRADRILIGVRPSKDTRFMDSNQGPGVVPTGRGIANHGRAAEGASGGALLTVANRVLDRRGPPGPGQPRRTQRRNPRYRGPEIRRGRRPGPARHRRRPAPSAANRGPPPIHQPGRLFCRTPKGDLIHGRQAGARCGSDGKQRHGRSLRAGTAAGPSGPSPHSWRPFRWPPAAPE